MKIFKQEIRVKILPCDAPEGYLLIAEIGTPDSWLLDLQCPPDQCIHSERVDLHIADFNPQEKMLVECEKVRSDLITDHAVKLREIDEKIAQLRALPAPVAS